jgi:peroxiredoxin
MMLFFNSSKVAMLYALLLFTFCSYAGKKQGILTAKFQNLPQGQWVYIYEYFGSELNKVDSVKSKDGKIIYALNKDFPRGFYKIGLDEEKSFPVILSPKEKLEVDVDLNAIQESFKSSGSKENEVFKMFNQLNIKHQDFFNSLSEGVKELKEKYSEQPENYEKGIAVLQTKLDSANAARTKQLQVYKTQNPDLFMAKYIAMFSIDGKNRETFFSKPDLEDSELTRGDMLPTKVAIFMQQYVQQDLESWKNASLEILQQATFKNRNKEVLYISIIRNMANSDIDFTRIIAKKYVEEFPESKYATYYWDAMPKEPPVKGDMAPDIKMSNPDGKMMSLSSLKGQVVLLDFWASWCGPCRVENPNVVRAYQKYKDKGFTVFSVSLDNDKAKWIKAIEVDKLEWDYHVSDLKGWQSSVARLYGVSGIPSTFLLDKNGKIIAQNLRGAALEQQLELLLGK